jgi:hypothetical protein
MQLVVLFTNAAQFERSGQLVIVYRSMDQHHPLAPSSTEEGNPHRPLFPSRLGARRVRNSSPAAAGAGQEADRVYPFHAQTSKSKIPATREVKTQIPEEVENSG